MFLAEGYALFRSHLCMYKYAISDCINVEGVERTLLGRLVHPAVPYVRYGE